MLEYPGRPVLTTLGNNTPHLAPALLSYLPPVQTLPYDLVTPLPSGAAVQLTSTTSMGAFSGAVSGTVSSMGSPVRGPGSAVRGTPGSPMSPGGTAPVPEWEEDLTLDVPPDLLESEDALLLAEVMQLPTSFRGYQRHPLDFQKTGGCLGHQVAWGFLRFKGVGTAAVGAAGRQMLLQLYRYKAPGAWVGVMQGGLCDELVCAFPCVLCVYACACVCLCMCASTCLRASM